MQSGRGMQPVRGGLDKKKAGRRQEGACALELFNTRPCPRFRGAAVLPLRYAKKGGKAGGGGGGGGKGGEEQDEGAAAGGAADAWDAGARSLLRVLMTSTPTPAVACVCRACVTVPLGLCSSMGFMWLPSHHTPSHSTLQPVIAQGPFESHGHPPLIYPSQPHAGASKGVGGAISMENYSDQTRRSMSIVDEEMINYDALAALLTHIVEEQRNKGAKACMDGWKEGLQGLASVSDEGRLGRIGFRSHSCA